MKCAFTCIMAAAAAATVFLCACSKEGAATAVPTVSQTTQVSAASQPVHTHVTGQWKVRRSPTCKMEGKKVRLCTDCGDVLESVMVPKSDHAFENGLCAYCMQVDIDDTKRINSLGNPYHSQYGADSAACIAWDLKVHDSMLHRGAGDYDINTGMFSMWAYNLTTQCWQYTGLSEDEEISRFIQIDGTLFAPGTDARGDWTLGNYYRYENGMWERFRTIPDGIHVWDMVKYDGKLFFGLGVDPRVRATPLAYMTEDGAFAFVPMYKGEVKREELTTITHLRAYELYICGGQLYAYVQMHNENAVTTGEIYRYEDDKFVFQSSAVEFLSGVQLSYRHFSGDAEYDGATYLVQNYLYSTTDGVKFTKIPMPDNRKVSDILVADDGLRVLTYKRNSQDKTYEIVVYNLVNGEPVETLRLTYALPPIAFDTDGEYMYISVGRIAGSDARNGTILRIKQES